MDYFNELQIILIQILLMFIKIKVIFHVRSFPIIHNYTMIRNLIQIHQPFISFIKLNYKFYLIFLN